MSTLGIGMFGMAMMIPDLSFQSSGTATAPAGSPSVGTAGGGGLPTNTAIQTLSLSLALVPLGLLSVAVFPPFARFVHYSNILDCSCNELFIIVHVFLQKQLYSHLNYNFQSKNTASCWSYLFGTKKHWQYSCNKQAKSSKVIRYN